MPLQVDSRANFLAVFSLIIPFLEFGLSQGILIAGNFIRKFKVKHLEKAIMLLCFGIIISIYFQDIMQLRILSAKLNKVEFTNSWGKNQEGLARSWYGEISVMTRSSYLSYYSGASFYLLPYGEYPEVIKFAKQRVWISSMWISMVSQPHNYRFF